MALKIHWNKFWSMRATRLGTELACFRASTRGPVCLEAVSPPVTIGGGAWGVVIGVLALLVSIDGLAVFCWIDSILMGFLLGIGLLERGMTLIVLER